MGRASEARGEGGWLCFHSPVCECNATHLHPAYHPHPAIIPPRSGVGNSLPWSFKFESSTVSFALDTGMPRLAAVLREEAAATWIFDFAVVVEAHIGYHGIGG